MEKQLLRMAKIALGLGISAFVGIAVAVVSAVVGHAVLVLLYGDDLSTIDDTLPVFVAVSAPYLAGIVSAVVVFIVGWRHLVRGRSQADSRRLAYALGWSLVGWVAAIVAGNVLYGSANALVYVIGVGFGVAAYLLLLFRDRRGAVRSTAGP